MENVELLEMMPLRETKIGIHPRKQSVFCSFNESAEEWIFFLIALGTILLPSEPGGYFQF